MADTVKIAVCDDEKNIRAYLVSLIKKQGAECSIVEYASAGEYLADRKEHDLVFLDIEMGGSGAELDGMGLARHIRSMAAGRQPIIIFITGYEKYVYDAFDVGAFQYLVKPVDELCAGIHGLHFGGKPMSGAVFEMINNILDMWKFAMQAVMFLVLWSAVFSVKKGKRDDIAAVLFLFANIGLGILPCAAWVRYAVLALLVLGYSGMNYKKQIGKAVFVMLGFYNLHNLSYLMAGSIYEKTMGVMMNGLDIMQSNYQQGMNQCMVVRIDRVAFVLFDEKPDLLWKVPMIAVFIFAGEAVLIYFWQKYRILLAERQKHFVEEQQVKFMKKRLEEAENFYGSIRRVRHEMKNHMAKIKGLAEIGQYGEIEEYVRRMDETMQELEYRYVTGNAVTDVIINDKWRRAEKAGIRFEADFRYDGEIPVFDLGIILNNLLDNAIEACEKLEPGKGFIHLALKRRKQFLLLEVENSFDGIVLSREESSLPVTTKQSTLPGIITEHGIGLQNVRDVAERYFGGVKIKVKGDVFHVTVMLQQGEMKESYAELEKIPRDRTIAKG